MTNDMLDTRAVRAATWIAIAACCAPPLLLQHLPMQELPQYVALSRMLYRLSDPQLGFTQYYELDLSRSIALVPLYLLGGLAEVLPLEAATRIVVWLSVLSYPLGLCALLRVQQKPLVYALLGLPLVYAAPFYLGLLPSLASTGLALLAIALFHAPAGRRYTLGIVSTLLPLTHPFGACFALAHITMASVLDRSGWRRTPWAALAPLICGCVYWGIRALQSDGVAAFSYPGLLFRLVRLSDSVMGGFLQRGEAYMLGGMIVLWLLLHRGHRPTAPIERALWLTTGACFLGYLLLPSSTWSTTVIHVRAGVMGLALLPAVLPAHSRGTSSERAVCLLFALAAFSVWQTSAQLFRFDKEARAFTAIMERVPARPKLLSLIYDNHGKLARGSPYLQFAAYAQAQHGGLLSLSIADYAWTVPVRKRADAPALPPVFGSEWNPTWMHDHPEQLGFYDAVLTRGTEPREMTIMSVTSFQLAAHSGNWLLYVRPDR